MSAATVVFQRALAEMMRGNLDLVNDDIRVHALKPDYTPDKDAHNFLDDVSASFRLGTAVAISSAAVSDAGVFSCANPTVTDPDADEQCAQLLFFRYNASEASALLVACYAAWREAPLPTTGGAIEFQLPSGGVFRLVG